MNLSRYKYYFSVLLFLLISRVAMAGDGHAHFDQPAAANSATVKFIENLGQWHQNILFQADLPGGRVFLERNRLLYNFYSNENFHDQFFHTRGKEALVLDRHNFFMHFEGANLPASVSGQQKQPEYHNYFLGSDESKWRGNVGLYKGVYYEEIYPGIDLGFQGLDRAFKYEFYVQKGGDPSQIQLKFEGLSDIWLEEGNLHLKTTLNEIIEQAPVAYQHLGCDGKVPVECHFKLDGDVITFEFPQGYNKNVELVIDPTLIFGTFTGSFADNFGYTATYDNNGNLYAGGVAFGQGYDTTAGAFQTIFGGGGFGGLFGPIDISITKFNPVGTALVYSTFLGGSANEQPHSMIVTPTGELLVTGRTYSTNFPVTAGAFQGANGGSADITVTKFNAAGSALIGSTYIGGSAEDAVNVTTVFGGNSLKYNYGDDARSEIMLDAANNVYVATETKSANFPITTGAAQATFGGIQDGVVFRMNPNLTALNWSTFLGGSANDGAYSVKVDAAGNAYVCGGTASTNFPVTNGSTNNGGIDGYIAIINNTGTAITAATYVGTSAYDQTYFLELDLAGDIYVVGQTLGNYPVSAGVYNNAGGTQFIHKFSSSLNSIFSTRFGSGTSVVNISPTAFLVDICGYIYVSGWGGGTNHAGTGTTNGMPITANAFQNTTDGSDLYLMVLQPNAAGLEYGTFFGGPISEEHVDGGTSRFNKDLEVYQAVCAGCGGNSDFPTTPGAWSATNNAPPGRCNEGLFKFKFDAQTIVADFNSSVQAGCAPYPATFTNNSTGGVSFLWTFGDGSTDTAVNPIHTYTVADTYVVHLYIIDSSSCNVVDSTADTVFVYDVPTVAISGDTSGCNGAPVPLMASGGTSYLWKPAAGLSNPNIANPWASPTGTTVYTVIVSNPGGCMDSSTVTVTVSNFDAEAGVTTSFCEGSGGAQLLGGGVGSTATPFWFEWWCDSSQTNCGIDSINDNDPNVNPTQTTTYYLQVTDWNGCKSRVDSVVVTVLKNPIVDAGPDVAICAPNAPGSLIGATVTNPGDAPGPYIFAWSPAAGLNDSTYANPYARPDSTTIYTCIVTSSGNGCTSFVTTVDSLSSIVVTVKPMPIAYGGPDQDVCYLDSVLLPGIGYGAGPAYAYQWSPATGLADSSQPNPKASPPQTIEYYLTVWSNGCPSIADTVVVNVHTLPTADAGPFRDACRGDSVLLDGEADGDSTSTAYQYHWIPGLGLNANNLEDPMASPDTSTMYYLEVISSWGCHSPWDSVQVYLKPTPYAEAGENRILCFGDSTQLQGSIYYNGTDPVANPSQIWYTWSPPAGIADVHNPTSMVLPTTAYYYLQVQYNTCFTRDSVLITVFPDLNLQAGIDTSVICSGDSVQLFASGGLGNAEFAWNPPLGLSNAGIANPKASPQTSTVYQLIIRESECADTTEIPLEVIPTPVASYVNSLPSGCAPLDVSFLETSTDAINWIWNFGDGSPVANTANPLHTFTVPGTYWVTLTAVGPGNCRSEAALTQVTVNQAGLAEFSSDPTYPSTLMLPSGRVQFTDLSQEATSWYWDFGDGSTSGEANPAHAFPINVEGIYYVTLRITDESGCVNEVTHGPYTVMSPELMIPNVFSPNGDGNNDLFLVNYTGSQPFVLQIYDRWGRIHFQTRNKNEGWSGVSSAELMEGNNLAEGVYFYQVTIGDKEYTGSLTLLR
ncbi:MAG: gliding motility-associated C-terminal domain-containing protein [Bacteroidia bacterium]|nr:gliding motility-associated C-terminal domain-containing protein [Bacteroidia bacterium]